MPVTYANQPSGRGIERLLPARLPEERRRIRRIEARQIVLAGTLLADQRPGQSIEVADIVEAESPLDTEPVAIGRAVAALDLEQPVVLDVVGELAADPAIRAQAVDHALGRFRLRTVCGDDARRQQRAGRAGLDALAAADAGAVSHRVVEIEDDLGACAAMGHTDDVVDLDLTAGPDAERARDAGIEIDRHCRVAAIGGGRALGLEPALGDADALGPAPQLRARIVGRRTGGLIGDQELEDHPARRRSALGGNVDDHPGAWLADAGGGEHPLAFDLNHAGAAVAVGSIARRGRIAEMRDLDTEPVGDLPDRLLRPRLHNPPVQRELAMSAHIAIHRHDLPARYILGKMTQDRQQPVGRRLTQPADRGIDHGHGQLQQQLPVPGRGGHQVNRFLAAGAAGRALAAALVLEEAHQVQRRGGDRIPVRQDDHRGRTDQAAMLLKRAEIERDVGHRGGQYAARGAAREVALEDMAGRHAAAMLLDQLADGDPSIGNLDAGPVHPAGDRIRPEPLAAVAAAACEPVRTVGQDVSDPV